MNTAIPTQYSTTVELPTSPHFSEVLVCFTPMLRAGCEADWRWSYVKFIFTLRVSGKPIEFSFMPVERWTDDHFDLWRKVKAMLPATFDIDSVFEQAALDLML